MAARRMLSTTGDIAMNILRFTATSSDVFPPLKSAAGDALRIAETVKEFRSNKNEWHNLGAYLQDATARVVDSIARAGATTRETAERLERLHSTLVAILKEIEFERSLSGRQRLRRFRQDPERISNMRNRVDDIIGLFQLGATVTTMVDVKKTLDAVEASSRTLSGIAQSASGIAQHVALDKLRRVQGASWDPSRGCLENTRVNIINRIRSWIESVPSNSSNDMAGVKIIILTAVAGAGKTTIAHTVASLCAKDKSLGSSFFFDHETEGRNSPVALFTTIASDLSRIDPRISDRMVTALEEDWGLPTAPISRQFDGLILQSCQGVSFSKPVVVVIDGLDEAWDDDLLRILRDSASGLPDMFRIFITSRMRPELDRLIRMAHVKMVELDIGDQANMEDMAEYVAYKLRELAEDRNLDNDWPGSTVKAEFTTKAGGLFLWVATVCDYLRHRSDPTMELEKLIRSTDLDSGTAEMRMDRLYATILDSFEWSDGPFVEVYKRVMGVAIASKTPLTISAIKELYHTQPISYDFALRSLSPLLTGMNTTDGKSQPVRMLHQSLRDFLILRSTSSPDAARLDEKRQSGELALLCLNILNRNLGQAIPVAGYLSDKSKRDRGVPTMDSNTLSEALWYACQYWPDHICDVDDPKIVQDPLLELMENNIVAWLEVMASCGQCRDLSGVRKWMQNNLETQIISRIHGWAEDYTDACWSLWSLLDYDDRREDLLTVTQESVILYRQLAIDSPEVCSPRLAQAILLLSYSSSKVGQHDQGLELINEAVDMYRKLAADRPAVYTSYLAGSLHNLSVRLSDVGRNEEALPVIQEAVNMYRNLAADRPAVYTSDLAESLHSLSVRLSDVGRNEEALPVTQEVVDMNRNLAADRPAVYTSYLAGSLHNLSVRLSDVGRNEEALPVIQEAVDMYRNLAADRPAVYTSDLAESLHNLSVRLSDVGRNEKALPVIQEAVDMYRNLAADRPAVYTSYLAGSLNNLSARLSDVGRNEEALPVIQEAVDMYRNLAADRPAVYTSDLARSLHSLSVRLSDVGRNEEALPVIQEAVDMYRNLAADRPAVYTSYLAGSLNNLSARLSDVGRNEEALPVIQEAVDMYRNLAADRPAVYTSDLARSLHNLSVRLSDVGRNEEALPVIQEAVAMRRNLAADRPAVYTSYLARSLHSLSLHLSDVGRNEEALPVIQEAVDMYRNLAADRPAVYTPYLAGSLNNLSARLSDVGRNEEALPVIQEAVDMYRNLAADRPAVYTSDLARSLHNLSVRLSDVGRNEEALPVIQEAVAMRRNLAADRPAVYTSYLARSLHSLSLHLSDVGRNEEALPVIQEAVDMYRNLAADRPAVYTFDLARSLNDLSVRLSDVGRNEEALPVIQEAVDMYRNLAADRPVVHASDLALGLFARSVTVSRLKHFEEALSTLEESTEIYRQLSKTRPLIFNPHLKRNLQLLSHNFRSLNRYKEATQASREADNL